VGLGSFGEKADGKRRKRGGKKWGSQETDTKQRESLERVERAIPMSRAKEKGAQVVKKGPSTASRCARRKWGREILRKEGEGSAFLPRSRIADGLKDWKECHCVEEGDRSDRKEVRNVKRGSLWEGGELNSRLFG